MRADLERELWRELQALPRVPKGDELLLLEAARQVYREILRRFPDDPYGARSRELSEQEGLGLLLPTTPLEPDPRLP